jgi:hypothetical protein
MNKLELVNQYLEDTDITTLSADGFDDAILGIAGEKIVYSVSKCLDILIKRDKMTKEEAYEYFEFNVEGAYMGEKTPIWVDDLMLCDI